MRANVGKIFRGPGVLKSYVKVRNVAKEFGFIESGVALFKRSNVVHHRSGGLCGNVHPSVSSGNVLSDGVLSDDCDNDYNNYYCGDRDFKKAEISGRNGYGIGRIIASAIAVIIVIIITGVPAGIPAGIKSSAEIRTAPIGTAGKIAEIGESNG